MPRFVKFCILSLHLRTPSPGKVEKLGSVVGPRWAINSIWTRLSRSFGLSKRKMFALKLSYRSSSTEKNQDWGDEDRNRTKQRWLLPHQALGIVVLLLSLLPFDHQGLGASRVPALSCADWVEFLPSKTTQHKRSLTLSLI